MPNEWVNLLILGLDIAFAILLFFVWKSQRRINPEVLAEIDQERDIMAAEKKAIFERLAQSEQKLEQLIESARHIASVIEMESSQVSHNLARDLDSTIMDQKQKLIESLTVVDEKIRAIDDRIHKAHLERQRLLKVLDRGEKLYAFFKGEKGAEITLEDIRDSKHAEARQLLAQGTDPHVVAKQLKLSQTELSLLQDMRI